jgi:hypothetical protein
MENKDNQFKQFSVLYNIRMTDRQTFVMHNYAQEQALLNEINEAMLTESGYQEAKAVINYIKNL